MNKTQFIQSIEPGKWFQTKDKNGRHFLVKLAFQSEANAIISLWLSNEDHESMAYSQTKFEEFTFEDGTFSTHSSFTYHIGSTDFGKDCIYNTEGTLVLEKLKAAVISACQHNFITDTEFDDVWNEIENVNYKSFPFLVTA
ncbi:hypothetical protein [Bacillus bombysepticus]|uniref:hypothetical protein n=1 Tax=Bacillus bombysepticus TaxID=658666 RepID=UPI0030193093